MSGFLGTRGDFIVDFVMVFSGVLPFLMLYTFYLASKKRFALHKNLQMLLLLLLTIGVIALELDIKFGSIEQVMMASPYYGTKLLLGIFIIHLIFAISTFFLWSYLVFKSATIYPKPFKEFNHKFWGKFVFFDMILTAVTGWMLYILLFAINIK